MRQSTVAQRWPNSARMAWLAAKARQEAEREASQLARWATLRHRAPKAPPTRAQELGGEIHKLLEPLVQLEQVGVLEGIRDYLTHLRLSPRDPDSLEETPPPSPDYSADIPF